MKGARRHRRFKWASPHIIPRNHLNRRHAAVGAFGEDAKDSAEYRARIGLQIVMQHKGQSAAGQKRLVFLIQVMTDENMA